MWHELLHLRCTQGCPQNYVLSSFSGIDKQAALMLAPEVDIWVNEITIAGTCPYKNSTDQCVQAALTAAECICRHVNYYLWATGFNLCSHAALVLL
jgi:hypothetical protein